MQNNLTPYQQFQVDRYGNILARDGYTFLDENSDTHHFVDDGPEELENGFEEQERSGLLLDEQVLLQLDDEIGY